MTQTISPYYNPYDSPYFDSLPIFSLFPITMTFCSSKRSVMLLHQGVQILSALCLKCNSYRHLYRFFLHFLQVYSIISSHKDFPWTFPFSLLFTQTLSSLNKSYLYLPCSLSSSPNQNIRLMRTGNFKILFPWCQEKGLYLYQVLNF